MSDLSPFYLSRARDNLKYWKKMRQPGSYLGGSDDNGVEFLQVRLSLEGAVWGRAMCVWWWGGGGSRGGGGGGGAVGGGGGGGGGPGGGAAMAMEVAAGLL